MLRDFNKILKGFPLKGFELISGDLLSVTPPFSTPSLGEPGQFLRFLLGLSAASREDLWHFVEHLLLPLRDLVGMNLVLLSGAENS